MDRKNVFEFQGSKMIMSAKGPNFNKNLTMNTRFRPNLLSSTMNMPRNFEKQSSAASVASQKSIYHGRDTSPPASICSDLQPRNFHQPFYQRGYSQRSVCNREGSPMSMRSINSTASRADTFIDEIKNWTVDELEKVWHVVERKLEFKKKAQKRKKIKMFLKNHKNRSEDDAEEGSRSSMSNDDCASTRTGYSRRYDPYCKENIPQSLKSFDCRSEDTYRSNHNPYRGYARSESQIPYLTGSNPYHPGNTLPYHKQPQFGPAYFSQKNGHSQNGSSLYPHGYTGLKNTLFSQRCMNGQPNMSSMQRNNLNGSMCSTKSMQNMTVMSQRDRFRGGLQLPSQKFNRSTLHNEQEDIRNQFSIKHCANKVQTKCREPIDELSDENDIFLDTTVKSKTVAKKTEKRKVESLEDIPNPTRKKAKMTSSNDKAKKQTKKDNNENNEFEFVKPLFPIRKSAPARPREKLMSKSSGAPYLISNTQENENSHLDPAPLSPEPDIEPELSEDTQLTTSDMSMRPSFMKRKLFTQTLDVTEKRSNSFESGTDSPRSNIYSALTREKHKTRKLVNSQSLLSRDVNQGDDNLLDLIHKIVPPNQVNSTVTANTRKQTNSRVSGTKNANDDDKWDITSIISTCNNDTVSETYTDDEIFRLGNDKQSKVQEKSVPKKVKTDDKNNKPTKPNEQTKPKPEIKKTKNVIPSNNKNVKEVVKKMTLPATTKAATPAKTCPAKRVVLTRSRIDAFWDTDESDHEGALPPRNLQDQTQHHIASPRTLLTKEKSNQPKVLNPLVVLHDLHKDVKKQPIKKVQNKTNNEPKAQKKSSDVDITKANKLDKTKKETKTITPRTRKQLNLTAMSETVNNSLLNEKDTSVNETAPTKTTTQKMQKNEKKATQEKNIKTKPSSEIKKGRNKKQNDSQSQINISKTREDTPKSQETVKNNIKTTKLREPAEHLKMDICKVLRSRMIDLTSSFNSDEFELTMSRTRRSRTLSKRISFNKSKNILVNNTKIRSRATKS